MPTGYNYEGSLYEVAQYLEDLLQEYSRALDLKDVFYGDQDRIPRSPAACIEPGDKRRELAGIGRATKVVMTCYIIIYHGEVTTVRDNRRENDLLAERVETIIHSKPTMDDKVIDSLVTSIESGYQLKTRTLFRATRLTIEAQAKTLLPQEV
jgi:hypothetical protein